MLAAGSLLGKALPGELSGVDMSAYGGELGGTQQLGARAGARATPLQRLLEAEWPRPSRAATSIVTITRFRDRYARTKTEEQ